MRSRELDVMAITRMSTVDNDRNNHAGPQESSGPPTLVLPIGRRVEPQVQWPCSGNLSNCAQTGVINGR